MGVTGLVWVVVAGLLLAVLASHDSQTQHQVSSAQPLPSTDALEWLNRLGTDGWVAAGHAQQEENEVKPGHFSNQKDNEKETAERSNKSKLLAEKTEMSEDAREEQERRDLQKLTEAGEEVMAAAARQLFGTGGDTSITINPQGLLAGLLYLLLGGLLIWALVIVISGKGAGYWGRWANDPASSYSHYSPSYYDDRASSAYTAYRTLDEAAQKYK